ncbi:MAG TPA: hypothetical protein ENK67_02050 [Flavobacteriia bacterium]|nr:hypothetical protein [Flavobacteriia bacterium]
MNRYQVTMLHFLWTILSIFLIGSIGFLWDDNFSVLVLAIIFMTIGIVITYIVNLNGDKKNSIYIFLLFFAIYLAYNLIISISLINFYGVQNIKSDEIWFYNTSNDVYKMLENGQGFVDVMNVTRYGDTYGVLYLYGWIAYLANIFGENSVFVQKIGVVTFSALIPMVMYGISRLYFTEKQSLSIAIIYGLFSFVPFFGSTLMRDIHIALMFILTIYFILQKLTFFNLFLLVIVSAYSYTLREQTGIFMMFFILIYLFIAVESSYFSRAIKNFIYLLFLLVIIASVLASDYLMAKFLQIFERSAERSQDKAAAASLGRKIAELPFGLNILALFSFGQIQPFPPSLIFKSGHKGLLELTLLSAGIAWFFGWLFLVYGILKEKILSKLDLKLLLLFIFSIAFIVLNSLIQFSQRRQMAVYPILYIVMVMSYFSISKTEKTKVLLLGILLYITLVLAVNYLKL